MSIGRPKNIFLFLKRQSVFPELEVFSLTASIFAYGQTSSGKTYTMTGVTEYTVADIYDYINKVYASILRSHGLFFFCFFGCSITKFSKDTSFGNTAQ